MENLSVCRSLFKERRDELFSDFRGVELISNVIWAQLELPNFWVWLLKSSANSWFTAEHWEYKGYLQTVQVRPFCMQKDECVSNVMITVCRWLPLMYSWLWHLSLKQNLEPDNLCEIALVQSNRRILCHRHYPICLSGVTLWAWTYELDNMLMLLTTLT